MGWILYNTLLYMQPFPCPRIARRDCVSYGTYVLELELELGTRDSGTVLYRKYHNCRASTDSLPQELPYQSN